MWGIAHHSNIKQITERNQEGKIINAETIKTENPIYDDYLNSIKSYWSFEGYIVKLADEIAQRHHDIEDSLQYGIVTRNTIIEKLNEFKVLFKPEDKKTYSKLNEGIDSLSDSVFASVYSRLMVNIYVVNAITQTKNNLRMLGQEYGIHSQKDFANAKSLIPKDVYEKVVSFSDELTHIDFSFQEFLQTSVLSSYSAQAMDGKGEYIIRKLNSAFSNNPSQLPDTAIASFCEQINIPFNRATFKDHIEKNKDVLHRCIIDYIGGMTDRYAYDEYDRLYGTKC